MSHALNRLDTELSDLKNLILSMGGLVEKALEEANDALLNRNLERIKKVFDNEREVNRLHKEIDEGCLKFLATQAPVANDLRLILSIVKINSDLERMGDQAVNIAQNARYYLAEPELKPLIDLPIMMRESRKMVKDSLDSFVKVDRELAQKVLEHDDIVDDLKSKIMKDVIEIMKTDSTSIERALNLILIAKNLERVGDLATNIAENVIFYSTGEDIRHLGGKIQKK